MPRIKYVQTINRIVMKQGEYASKYASATCMRISPDVKHLGINFYIQSPQLFRTERERRYPKRKTSKNVTDIEKRKRKKYRYLLKSTGSYARI